MFKQPTALSGFVFAGLALAFAATGCTEKPSLYCPEEVITDTSHEDYGSCCNSEQGLEGAACSEGAPCCGGLTCLPSGVCGTGDVTEDMGSDMEDMTSDMTPDMTPADMGEDMVALPCDGACEGDTPVCDEANNTCVGCLDVSHCDGDTPACDTSTNTCVACTDETFCDGDTPVCDTSSTTCVGCLGDENCSGDTPVCDTSSTTCVGCLDNTSCESPDASLCGADQTCGACMADADCSHLGLNRCVQGVCTECTVATEQDDCGNNACLPDGTCGDTPLESLTACQPCQADNECFADHRCVPMNFGDPAMPHGNYCLKIASTMCERPYTVSISQESVSGAASEEYCGINQVNTTCEAIIDLRNSKDCVEDSDCGAQGLDDAVCGTTLAGDVCTITCELNSQCSSVQTCDMAENYCK